MFEAFYVAAITSALIGTTSAAPAITVHTAITTAAIAQAVAGAVAAVDVLVAEKTS